MPLFYFDFMKRGASEPSDTATAICSGIPTAVDHAKFLLNGRGRLKGADFVRIREDNSSTLIFWPALGVGEGKS